MDMEDTREREKVAAGPPGVAAGWADALEAQFGTVPWWVISSAVHVAALALMSLVAFSTPRTADEVAVRLTPVASPEPEDLKPQPPVEHRQLFETEEKVTAEFTYLPHFTDEPADLPETENLEPAEETGAFGHQDQISDIPLMDRGVVAFIGIGPGLPAGSFGDPWRRGTRMRRPFGVGTPVGPPRDDIYEDALKWLARHQEPDGRWDGEKYEGRDTDAGITGLALLAFLSAGHTERTGRYRDNVVRAVNWLVSKQDESGCVGRGYDGGLGYHHSIAGLALAEAWGMGRVARTGVAAQKAVDYSVNVHQLEYSGWRYKPKEKPDMSVTGWFVMQVKSAQVAGLKVPGQAVQGALAFLDSCTKDEGTYNGLVSYQPERRATPTMTSVGLVSRQFLGHKRNDPLVVGPAHYLMGNLPEGARCDNFYYLYYGTLGMFQMGGDFWKAWGPRMKEILEGSQRKGGPEIDGSWDPTGQWCAKGGRVFSTAMAALCIQVWWRYLPLYGRAD